MRGRPPTMGRTLFGQWVRIFKAMTAAKAMDTLSAVCEHYIGRALTKVGCKRLFFLSPINAKFPLTLSFFFFNQDCLTYLSEEIEKLDMEDISLGPHYCFGVSCTLNYLLKYYQLSSELPRASKSKGIFFGGCTLIHSFMCLWSMVFYLMYMLPVSAVKIQRKPLSGEKAASVLKWVINFQYLNINLHN